MNNRPWSVWYSDNKDYALACDGSVKNDPACKVETADLHIAQYEDIERVLTDAGIETFGEDDVANGIGDWNVCSFGYGEEDDACREALLNAGYNCLAFEDEVPNNESARADAIIILDPSLLTPVKASEAYKSKLTIKVRNSK